MPDSKRSESQLPGKTRKDSQNNLTDKVLSLTIKASQVQGLKISQKFNRNYFKKSFVIPSSKDMKILIIFQSFSCVFLFFFFYKLGVTFKQLFRLHNISSTFSFVIKYPCES